VSNNAVALFIVDSREPLPGAEEESPISPYSVVGLPRRRQALRENADHMAIISEILYELGNPDHEEAGIKSVITQLNAVDFKTLLTDEVELIKATSWSDQLRSYLQEKDKTLLLIPFRP
jgi:hypothetical protein